MMRIPMVLAALVACAIPASAQSASLYFDAQTPKGTVAVGDTFTIAVRTDLSSAVLAGVDFSLSWDPAVLELEGRVLGDVWTTPFDVSDWIEATPGWVYFGCVEFTYPTEFPTDGTWTIVTYTFRVVGVGSTALTFGVGTMSVPGFLNDAGEEIAASPLVDGFYPTFDPPSILSAAAPYSATVGDLVELSAVVTNPGTSVPVTVEFWAGPAKLLGTASGTVSTGGTSTLTFTWNTAGAAAGTYAITAKLQGTAIEVPAGTLLLSMPVVPPTTTASSGGSGGGGGGCSAGGGFGNLAALIAALALLAIARLR